jgi:hypothetical protein
LTIGGTILCEKHVNVDINYKGIGIKEFSVPIVALASADFFQGRQKISRGRGQEVLFAYKYTKENLFF